VVWLTTVVSMAVIELMFPGIYGGSLVVVAGEALMLAAYLALAWMAARERPPPRVSQPDPMRLLPPATGRRTFYLRIGGSPGRD
jgi:hypothetical protein